MLDLDDYLQIMNRLSRTPHEMLIFFFDHYRDLKVKAMVDFNSIFFLSVANFHIGNDISAVYWLIKLRKNKQFAFNKSLIIIIEKLNTQSAQDVSILITEYLHYMRIKKNENYGEDLQIVSKVNPDNELYQFELGLCFLEKNALQAAIDRFNAVITIDHTHANGFYYLGEAYLKLRDYKNAKKKVLKAIAINNAISEYHYLLSQIYYSLNDFATAEACLRGITKRWPRHFYYHRKLALLLKEQEKYKESEQEYLQLIKIESNNFINYRYLGELYVQQQAWAKAATSFSKAIALDVDNTSSALNYLKLGSVFKELKNYGAAEESFKKSLALKPSIEAYQCLGVILEIENRCNDAIACYTAAIKLVPHDDFSYVQLGRLYYKQGNLQRAKYCFSCALHLRPNAYTYLRLGNVLYQQAKNDRLTEELYKIAIQLSPNDFLNYACLGELFFDQNKLKEATEQIHKGLLLEPNDDIGHIRMGIIFIEFKKYNEAETHLRKALTINQTVIAHQKLGLVLLKLQRFDEALIHLNHANRLEPDALTYHYLGYISYHCKDLMQAAKYFQQAIRLSPNNSFYQRNLGRVYLELSNFGESEMFIKSAITLAPAEASYRRDLALVFESQGKYQEAESQLKIALAMNPCHLNNYLYLGYLSNRQYKTEAIRYYQRALHLERSPQIYKQLALTLFQHKRYEQATKIFAMECFAADVKSLHCLGIMSERRSHHEKAEGYFRNALSLEPANAFINRDFGALMEKIKKRDEAGKYYLIAHNLDNNVACSLRAYLEDIAKIFTSFGYHKEAHTLYNEAKDVIDEDQNIETTIINTKALLAKLKNNARNVESKRDVVRLLNEVKDTLPQVTVAEKNNKIFATTENQVIASMHYQHRNSKGIHPFISDITRAIAQFEEVGVDNKKLRI